MHNWVLRNNPFKPDTSADSDLIPASPALAKSVSQSTSVLSALKKVALRVSSGYDRTLISDDNSVQCSRPLPSVVADRVFLTEGKYYFEGRTTNL